MIILSISDSESSEAEQDEMQVKASSHDDVFSVVATCKEIQERISGI
jgi:hypothetical protein